MVVIFVRVFQQFNGLLKSLTIQKRDLFEKSFPTIWNFETKFFLNFTTIITMLLNRWIMLCPDWTCSSLNFQYLASTIITFVNRHVITISRQFLFQLVIFIFPSTVIPITKHNVTTIIFLVHFLFLNSN
jgi:hypothetical protein